MGLHPELRKRLKLPDDVSDNQVIRFFRQRTRRYCKPCWELKYCPYGPLVEDFPLLPISIEAAKEHQAFLQECLAQGYFPDGTKLTAKKRLWNRRILSLERSSQTEKRPGPLNRLMIIRPASYLQFARIFPCSDRFHRHLESVLFDCQLSQATFSDS